MDNQAKQSGTLFAGFRPCHIYDGRAAIFHRWVDEPRSQLVPVRREQKGECDVNNVDWVALYQSMDRQNGDLQVTVDKLRNEIIPQYEALLKKANAERAEANKQRVLTAARIDAALAQLNGYGCATCAGCEYGTRPKYYAYCLSNKYKLWKWKGPEEGRNE